MIDKATRQRWRKLMDAGTAGPWVALWSGGSVTVQSVTYQRPVPIEHDEHNAALVAEQRDGWPRTLDELEHVEGQRDRARDEVEVLTAEVRAARLLIAALTAQRDEAVSLADSARRAAADDRAALEETSRLLQQVTNHIQPLREALAKWQRYRHAPTLLAAIERYEDACKQSS